MSFHPRILFSVLLSILALGGVAIAGRTGSRSGRDTIYRSQPRRWGVLATLSLGPSGDVFVQTDATAGNRIDVFDRGREESLQRPAPMRPAVRAVSSPAPSWTASPRRTHSSTTTATCLP